MDLALCSIGCHARLRGTLVCAHLQTNDCFTLLQCFLVKLTYILLWFLCTKGRPRISWLALGLRNKHHHSMWLVTANTLKYPLVYPLNLVSEPDPQKIEKDSGKLGGIEVYTVEYVRNSISFWTSVNRSAEPDPPTSISNPFHLVFTAC